MDDCKKNHAAGAGIICIPKVIADRINLCFGHTAFFKQLPAGGIHRAFTGFNVTALCFPGAAGLMTAQKPFILIPRTDHNIFVGHQRIQGMDFTLERKSVMCFLCHSVYSSDRIAQRILVDLARGFWKHSSAEGRITSWATSL